MASGLSFGHDADSFDANNLVFERSLRSASTVDTTCRTSLDGSCQTALLARSECAPNAYHIRQSRFNVLHKLTCCAPAPDLGW